MLGAALDSMFVPDSHKRLESLRQKHTRVAVALGGLHTEARIKAPELNFLKKHASESSRPKMLYTNDSQTGLYNN